MRRPETPIPRYKDTGIAIAIADPLASPTASTKTPEHQCYDLDMPITQSVH
nr:hypothetical protein Q903MT_gene3320 [Picea sitchensis]